MQLNLLPKLEQFKNCLKQWQHRKLTLLGKVTVIKSFALPKLIYSEVANSGSLGMVHGTVECSKLRSINNFSGYTVY